MKVMNINSVDLYISAVRRSQYPEEGYPEFIMVGRSNVGKSSFMNTLVNRKSLARISARPGKTNTINFYLVNDSFFLVDVPGYGYAAVNKEEQKKFGMMVEEYLETRTILKRVFLLIDFRHKPTEDDVLMYNYLKHYNIPVTIVATKADKVGGSQKDKNIKQLKETLDLVVGDDIIIFSSVSKLGREEVITKIEGLLTSNN